MATKRNEVARRVSTKGRAANATSRSQAARKTTQTLGVRTKKGASTISVATRTTKVAGRTGPEKQSRLVVVFVIAFTLLSLIFLGMTYWQYARL